MANNYQENSRASYNRVESFNLRVFKVRQTRSGNLMLNCGFPGRKKEDGTYGKGLNGTVFLKTDGSVNIPNVDLTNKYISVNGNFSISEWTNQEGITLPRFQIWADSIKIRQFENQNRGNYNNNNYRQNNQRSYANNNRSSYNNQQNDRYASWNNNYTSQNSNRNSNNNRQAQNDKQAQFEEFIDNISDQGVYQGFPF